MNPITNNTVASLDTKMNEAALARGRPAEHSPHAVATFASVGSTVQPTAAVCTSGLEHGENLCPQVSITARTSTGIAQAKLTMGFDLLERQEWRSAIELFRTLKPETQKHKLLRIYGLACAFYLQPTDLTAMASKLLYQESLPAGDAITPLLARCNALRARKQNAEAGELLTNIFKMESGNLRGGIPCRNHAVNLALAHFWWSTYRYFGAEALLLATFQQEGGDVARGSPCHNHETNLALVTIWQNTGKRSQAEALLAATFRQESGNLETDQPCQNPETNLMVATHCLQIKNYDRVVRLAIATSATIGGIRPVKRLVHFIRHAEGRHNLARRTDPKHWHLRDDLLDPELTETGMKQCGEFAERSAQHLRKAQLVVMSPMNRTIQTATESLPYLKKTAQWLALESIRERIVSLCGQRLPLSRHKTSYPHVNFDQITFDDDILGCVYQSDRGRESSACVIQRCIELIKWLSNRPEKEVVVVTHGDLLQHLYGYVLKKPDINNEVRINNNIDCWQPVRQQVAAFGNCEMRSLMLNTFPT